MVDQHRNSFDLLRLFAAALVLYSHQHALLGLAEPDVFGWTSFGGLGVSIFFFLSGLLVWSSWVRDPDLKRFFVRRTLRILPALWFVVLFSILILGPALSTLTVADYFSSAETRRYLSTAVLIVRRGLPGVFADNPYPGAFNGSLWTLPVEFLCYVSVAVVGSMSLLRRDWMLGLNLALVVLMTTLGPQLLGSKFAPHFEMVAFFWWGVLYGFVSERPKSEVTGWAVFLGAVLLIFMWVGPHSLQRTGVLFLASALVLGAQRVSWGSYLTDPVGDLSYGMYIFAFPVQQILVLSGRHHGWSFGMYVSLSFLITGVLAYVSWHALEKQALVFKPSRRVSA